MNKWAVILSLIGIFLSIEAVVANHRLVVFAVDGLHGDVFTNTHMSHSTKLARQGCLTYFMRGDLSWKSVFYGASSLELGTEHGLTPEFQYMPSWIDVLETAGDYRVYIHSDDPEAFKSVVKRNVMDMEEIDNHENTDSRALIVYHMTGLDRIGRVSGYMSINYKAAASCIDSRIDKLVRKGWNSNITFMLVSNHGGYFFDDKDINRKDTLSVPFAMWGRHVHPFPCSIHASQTAQIAPTLVSEVLHYPSPEAWMLHPIEGFGLFNASLFSPVAPTPTSPCSYPQMSTKHSAVKGSVYMLLGSLLGSALLIKLILS